MSSTWIHNVPNFVERRGGILPEGRSSVRASWEISRRGSPVRERREEDVQAGLWAVSQYVRDDLDFSISNQYFYPRFYTMKK